MVEVGDLAIEPEVNAGDGTGFEVGEVFAQGRGVGSLWQDTVDRVEGEGEDEIVERLFPVSLILVGDANLDLR